MRKAKWFADSHKTKAKAQTNEASVIMKSIILDIVDNNANYITANNDKQKKYLTPDVTTETCIIIHFRPEPNSAHVWENDVGVWPSEFTPGTSGTLSLDMTRAEGVYPFSWGHMSMGYKKGKQKQTQG